MSQKQPKATRGNISVLKQIVTGILPKWKFAANESNKACGDRLLRLIPANTTDARPPSDEADGHPTPLAACATKRDSLRLSLEG